MTDYVKYPKPSADKTAGRSAKQTGTVSLGGQHHISGTMGKHQRTGTGKEGGGNKGSY
jgi:hypothetical protein